MQVADKAVGMKLSAVKKTLADAGEVMWIVAWRCDCRVRVRK